MGSEHPFRDSAAPPGEEFLTSKRFANSSLTCSSTGCSCGSTSSSSNRGFGPMAARLPQQALLLRKRKIQQCYRLRCAFICVYMWLLEGVCSCERALRMLSGSMHCTGAELATPGSEGSAPSFRLFASLPVHILIALRPAELRDHSSEGCRSPAALVPTWWLWQLLKRLRGA